MQESVIRPCLFNFIIYMTEPRRLEYFQELMRNVIDKFPCRVIFIKTDERSDQEKFQVNVSTISSKREDAPIVCDSIVIEASGKQVAKVPFVILSYLVPDLPVYLTWGQDPCSQSNVLNYLEKIATRLIVDSESTDDLPQFSQKMLHKIQNLKCDVLDMNWARIQGWRNTIGQLFNTKEKIDLIKQAESIQITYNLKAVSSFYHHEIQALYLQAWLATQLNWKFRTLETHDRATRFHYTSENKQVVINFIPKLIEAFSPGTILSFEVNTNQWHFEIKRVEKLPQQVMVQVSTDETCDLPYYLPLSSRNTGFSFIKEVLYAPTSTHYIAMLETIAHHHLIASCIQ